MAEEKKSSNNFIIVLLVVISFFAGFLLFKVRSLEQKPTSQGQETVTQPSEPTQNLDAMPKLTNKDHIRGSLDAEVLLVEYSDLECPYCKTFHATMQQVMKNYGNKLAWVYRHYPLSFHTNAQKESEASECAAELGGNDAFWQYIDAIYERTTSNGSGFALDKLSPLATEIGLNETKFKQCLESGKYTKKVTDEMAGGGKAGIQGTPGTIIITKNGKKDFIGGALPLDQIKAQIDVLLK